MLIDLISVKQIAIDDNHVVVYIGRWVTVRSHFHDQALQHDPRMASQTPHQKAHIDTVKECQRVHAVTSHQLTTVHYGYLVCRLPRFGATFLK